MGITESGITKTWKKKVEEIGSWKNKTGRRCVWTKLEYINCGKTQNCGKTDQGAQIVQARRRLHNMDPLQVMYTARSVAANTFLLSCHVRKGTVTFLSTKSPEAPYIMKPSSLKFSTDLIKKWLSKYEYSGFHRLSWDTNLAVSKDITAECGCENF